MTPESMEIDAGSTAEMTQAALALERARGDQLARAVKSNRRIGIAVGIVMVVHRLPDVAAFEALRRASMNFNRKVADVAEDVIYLRRLPGLALDVDVGPATAQHRTGNKRTAEQRGSS